MIGRFQPPTIAQHKNEVHIAGVLLKQPLIRTTGGGKKVANLTIATTCKEYTEHVRVVAWERWADKVDGLAEGEFVQAVGRLQSRRFQDRDGSTRYITEVVAWQLVVPAKESVITSTTGAQITDADIPF